MLWDRKYVHFLGLALEAVPEEKRRLGSIIFFVALLHLLVFLCLRVSYPTPLPLQEARTHITLFTPDLANDEAGRQKDLWYQLNDPSRLIRIKSDWLQNNPLEIKLERPMELDSLPALLPSVSQDYLPVQLLSLAKKSTLHLDPPLQAFNYQLSNKPLVADQTVVYWDDNLRSRWMGDSWNLPTVSADLQQQLHITVLRLAVSPSGQVDHVLVENSSGKSDIDQKAVDAAFKLHFQPLTTNDLQWGRVSIYWKFAPAAPAN